MPRSPAPPASRRLRAIAAALSAAALLGGCNGAGGGPLGLVGPIPEGAATVDMLVVTTRVAVPDETRLFNGERDTRMHQSRLVVSIPPRADRKVGEVAWPSTTPADPERDFAVVAREIDLDEKGARAWFHRTGNGRALIFVHGYNTEYDEAVFRFAQFVHDSGTTFTPVLFTWASRGKLVEYVYDKESASYSRDAFETLLRAAARDPDVKEISILAHSMGTWLTMETLRQIAIRDGRLPAKIHDVILASPDIDGDVFRRQVSRLGRPRPRLTVFVSRDDKALGVSRLISGDIPRVGAVDPTAEPWKSTFAAEKVRVFDLTDVKTADELAHGKFAADGDVARLIGSRLVAGQPIDSARDGLGESVGGAIGGTLGTARDVAGAAVEAPLSVLGQ